MADKTIGAAVFAFMNSAPKSAYAAEDITALEADGFDKLFGPGSKTDDIADWITTEMERRFADQGDEE